MEVADILSPTADVPKTTVLAGGGNAAAGAATLASQAAIEKRRGRGRPPKSTATGTAPAGVDKRGIAQAQAEMEKALAELYKPEHWRGICKAPGDFMMALSGDPMWDIPDAEVNVLAAQSSLAARYFLATDPKWVALTLFAFAAATTYGTRAVLHMRKARAEKDN